MLVFYRYPYGSTMLHGRRIYGYLENHGPVVISWDLYKANQEDLIQASYDRDTLSLMFPGRNFPDISFTYSEIRYLNWEQMCALCRAFGFTTNRSNSSRRRKLRKFFKEHC